MFHNLLFLLNYLSLSHNAEVMTMYHLSILPEMAIPYLLLFSWNYCSFRWSQLLPIGIVSSSILWSRISFSKSQMLPIISVWLWWSSYRTSYFIIQHLLTLVQFTSSLAITLIQGFLFFISTRVLSKSFYFPLQLLTSFSLP